MVWQGENKPRRRLNGEKLEKLEYSVEKLIRDSVGIRHSSKRKAWASVHLGRDRYKASTYNPMLTFRIHVERCFTGMIELGYLQVEKRGYFDPTGNKFLTRYSATNKLIERFPTEVQKVLPVYIPQAQDSNPIRVQKNFKTIVDGKIVKQKKSLEYEETDDVLRMRSNLNQINNMFSRFWFDIRLEDEDFAKMQDRMLSKKQREAGVDRQLNLSKRRMHRVFNDTDMTLGGRFYGGWWQEVPKGYRHFIMIHGKPTVEFDYANLHPRILYAEKGIEPPEDCYSGVYPAISGYEFVKEKTMRKTVKVALNAMLNASETLKRPPRGFRRENCNCSWKELSEAILHKHKPIADKFYTGQGLRLQKIDSDIAEYVMLHFKDYDMPVLPLHDSFIIRSGYEETIKTVMQRAFKKFVGAEIKIKKKVVSNVDTLDEDERLVWDKKNTFKTGADAIITDDIYELLAAMEVGHEKRLDAFYSLTQSRQTE